MAHFPGFFYALDSAVSESEKHLDRFKNNVFCDQNMSYLVHACGCQSGSLKYFAKTADQSFFFSLGKANVLEMLLQLGMQHLS